MAAEFDHVIFFENPASSRRWVAERLADLLSGFRLDRISSQYADPVANAQDLAPRLDDGTCLVVAGGDGQLHAAVNAVALAQKDVTVEAMKVGNSCDGAYTQHGRIDFLRNPRALPYLLQEGQKVPVNSLRLTGVIDRWAALYAGVGLTARGAAMANRPSVRRTHKVASLGGRCHKLGRGVDTMAVGGNILWRTMCPETEVEVDGEKHKVLDLSFIIGHRIAGTMRTQGDAFKEQDPTIACVEISRRSLLRHHAAALFGAYAMGRVITADYTAANLDLTLPRRSLWHLDGDNVWADPGHLRLSIDKATYNTLVSPERAAELAA